MNRRQFMKGVGLTTLATVLHSYAQDEIIEQGEIEGIPYKVLQPERGVLNIVADVNGEEKTTRLYGSIESLDYRGENVFNEPEYVKSHFWFIPIAEEDFDVHIERQPRELDNIVKSLGRKRDRQRKYIYSQEQIIFENGNSLYVLNERGNLRYIFKIQGKYEPKDKKETDSKKDELEGDYKKLQELVRLNDEQLIRLYKIRGTEF
jgi:hypothetical protein